MHTLVEKLKAAGALVAILAAGGLWAKTVSPRMALTAARTHVEAMQEVWTLIPELEGRKVTVEEVRPLKDTAELLGYVAVLKPKGFVVLSADTGLPPIIAYSYRCDFPWQEHPQNILLDMVRTDLSFRKRALSELGRAVFSSAESRWRDYLDGGLRPAATQQWPPAGSTPTGGWVETTWNQGSPYNSYCPTDPQTGQRCVVGCVATAMSQIIDYHSNRREYLGKVEFGEWDRYVSNYTSPGIRIDQDASTYDFPAFPTLNDYLVELRERYVEGASLSNHNLATLCFACGVSVKMSYSSRGSGAVVSRVQLALRNKFEYPSAMLLYGSVAWFYDSLSSNMKDSLPAELAIYHADYTAGHAIVCDGLRETDGQDDEYHLNFGWGPNSPDPITSAWYVLPEGMPAGYSVIHSGVVSIVPPVKSYQPDNLIGLSPTAVSLGEDVYAADGAGQALTVNVDFNAGIAYYVKVENDGNLEHRIRVSAEENGDGWQVRYFEHETNKDITDRITGSGWLTPEFAPGEGTLLRVEVQVPADAQMGEVYAITVKSVSTADQSFADAVVLETSAAAEESEPSPDLFLAADVVSTRGAAWVSFGLPSTARVELSVFDVNGGLVRTLADERMQAGCHRILWDGRDARGRQVPSGTYFAVLRSADKTLKTKLVRLR